MRTPRRARAAEDAVMVIERLRPADRGAPRALSERGRRFAVVAFALGAAAIAIWTVMLAFYADRNVRVLWVGFDGLEMAGLAGTAWLTHRRDVRAALLAVAVSAAIVCDVWFDVSTAPSDYLPTSLVMAFTLEIPFAVICAIFALRTLRASLRDAGPSA